MESPGILADAERFGARLRLVGIAALLPPPGKAQTRPDTPRDVFNLTLPFATGKIRRYVLLAGPGGKGAPHFPPILSSFTFAGGRAFCAGRRISRSPLACPRSIRAGL